MRTILLLASSGPVKGVDLVNDIPAAAEIIKRIVAQAAATLTRGAAMVRK